MNQDAVVHYFTGTGNTRHAARIAAERLRAAGWTVTERPMDRCPPEAGAAELHWFLYPMYGFGAPALVTRYLSALSAPPGARAVVLAVGGSMRGEPGDEGVSLHRLSSLLRKRGFTVFYTNLVSYPINWTQFFNPPTPAESARICEQTDERVRRIADAVLRGETHLRKRSRRARAGLGLIYLAYRSLGRRLLGKLFTADDRCDGCSACARRCPASAIAMRHGRPAWDWRCEGCMRCINACPREAIQSSSARMLVFAAAGLLPFWPALAAGRAVSAPVLSLLAGIGVFLAATGLFLLAADRLLAFAGTRPAGRRLLAPGPSRRFRRYRGPGDGAGPSE